MVNSFALYAMEDSILQPAFLAVLGRSVRRVTENAALQQRYILKNPEGRAPSGIATVKVRAARAKCVQRLVQQSGSECHVLC